MTVGEIVALIAIIIAQVVLFVSGYLFGHSHMLKAVDKTFHAFMDNLDLDSVNEFCRSEQFDECEELAVKKFVVHLFEKVRDRI